MKSIIDRCLLAFSCLVFVGSAEAATRTWDGGGLDGVFSNPVNWDGNATAPISGLDTLAIGANTIGGSPFIGLNSGSEFRTPGVTFLATATAPYTVTAGSVSDVLTFTGTGVVLQNNSPVRQKFELITTTVGSATQTWNGGAAGLVMAQVDLGQDHTLSIDGTGTSVTARNEISGGITGTGTSGLTKIGSGTLLMNSNVPSDYTGATTVLGGRLLLGRANQIPDTSKLVLNGGIFDTGGFSDTMGALVLGGSSTLDFGLSDLLALVFADSHSELWSAGILNIVNFTPGGDTLRFGLDGNALTPAQLAQIRFDGTTPAMLTSNGFLQPVPEPGVPVALLAGAAILTCCRRRRAAA